VGLVHYLIEVALPDKNYLFKLRDELMAAGCVEKYSGDLGVYYAVILQCREGVLVTIGFSDIYYIDVVGKAGSVEKYVDVAVKVFPVNKILVHTVFREI